MSDIFSLFSSPGFWAVMIVLFIIKKGVHFVPQNSGYVIYRFGKYTKTLNSGLNFIIPFVESVASIVNLKEETISVPQQSAITKDNIALSVDAVIFIKVLDASSAVNNVTDYRLAVTQLAMTILRSQVGNLELDEIIQKRAEINAKVLEALSAPTMIWGVQSLRCEIKDVNIPVSIKEDMEKQMSAERQKRSAVLTAQGIKESAILKAEGEKQSAILNAEAEKAQQVLAAEASKDAQILEAQGKAEAIGLVAKADADAINQIGEAMESEKGKKATDYKITLEAIHAHAQIAKHGTVVLTDGKTGDNIGSTVAQALAVSSAVNSKLVA